MTKNDPCVFLRPLIILAFFLLFLGLSACAGTPPTRFYVLSPGVDSQVQSSEGLSIGVGPVKIPTYLDRLQIVTRSNINTLIVADFDRWAEPLESGFGRVLSEDLGKLLGTKSVAVYPWPPSSRIDCQVTVEVVRFEGTMGEGVVLEARWALVSDHGKSLYLKDVSKISLPVKENSYEALVAAQSGALAGLSREIAAAVLEAPRIRNTQ